MKSHVAINPFGRVTFACVNKDRGDFFFFKVIYIQSKKKKKTINNEINKN